MSQAASTAVSDSESGSIYETASPSGSSSNTILIVVIVVLILVGFVAIFRRKKGK